MPPRRWHIESPWGLTGGDPLALLQAPALLSATFDCLFINPIVEGRLETAVGLRYSRAEMLLRLPCLPTFMSPWISLPDSRKLSMRLLARIAVGQAACGSACMTLVVLDSGGMLCRLLHLFASTESGPCEMSQCVGGD